ncbi:hypothetical protein BJX65DRAFT_313396 [Aspergillus insuetus]
MAFLPTFRRRVAVDDGENTATELVRHACTMTLHKALNKLRALSAHQINATLAAEFQVTTRPLDLDLEATDEFTRYLQLLLAARPRLPQGSPPEPSRRRLPADSRDEASSWSRAKLEDSHAEESLQCHLLVEYEGGFDNDVLALELEKFGNANDSNLDPWIIDLGQAYISASDEPHVFISMIDHYLPSKDLLPAEVLLIIGVMITRYKVASLKHHRVIPYKARLLQDYMTEEGLVIMKSKLYDFYNPDVRSEHQRLFVSHFASRPVGDTKSLAYHLLLLGLVIFAMALLLLGGCARDPGSTRLA